MAGGGKGAITTGQGNAFIGLFVSFSVPLITLWVYKDTVLHSKAAFWPWVKMLAWANRPFAFWVLVSCMMGGMGIGRLMGGGSKVADAHQFTELDKV